MYVPRREVATIGLSLTGRDPSRALQAFARKALIDPMKLPHRSSRALYSHRGTVVPGRTAVVGGDRDLRGVGDSLVWVAGREKAL